MKKRSLGNALRAAALAGAVLLGACVGDGDELITGQVTPNGGTLFIRYVAMGNSITAGFQSAGINDSLQARAYPVLLAQRAGATFNYPAVSMPGCPRPFLAPLGTTGRRGHGGQLRAHQQPAHHQQRGGAGRPHPRRVRVPRRKPGLAEHAAGGAAHAGAGHDRGAPHLRLAVDRQQRRAGGVGERHPGPAHRGGGQHAYPAGHLPEPAERHRGLHQVRRTPRAPCWWAW